MTKDYRKGNKMKALKIKKSEVAFVRSLQITVYKANRNFFAVAEKFDPILFATNQAFDVNHTIGWKKIK